MLQRSDQTLAAYNCVSAKRNARASSPVRCAAKTLLTFMPENLNAGRDGPGRHSKEDTMKHHRVFLPLIMVILRIDVKIVVTRR